MTRPPASSRMPVSRRVGRVCAVACFFFFWSGTWSAIYGQVSAQKDYLSALEADKIRDAITPNERIKLFLAFADDRLKKFQYELKNPSVNRHALLLNSLLNAYVGCVDDAADLIQEGVEKQANIRLAVNLMATQSKVFLEELQKISTEYPNAEDFKDNLDDAIEGTREAMNEAEKAKKLVAAPPMRRKS
ncbi:MAG: hypothetical protein NVS9B4_12700 [Candidatus Acidiferrum sp.]